MGASGAAPSAAVAAAAADDNSAGNLKKRLFDGDSEMDTSVSQPGEAMRAGDEGAHNTSGLSLASFDERDALGVPDTFATPPTSQRKAAARARTAQTNSVTFAADAKMEEAADDDDEPASPQVSAAQLLGVQQTARISSGHVPLKRTLSTPVHPMQGATLKERLALVQQSQNLISRPPRRANVSGECDPLNASDGLLALRRREDMDKPETAAAASGGRPGHVRSGALRRRTGSVAAAARPEPAPAARAQGGIPLTRHQFRSVG